MDSLEPNKKIGYDLVLREVRGGTKVLDLGCGDGVLLDLLQRQKKVKGFGVEISEEGVSMCVEKGLYCFQGDIDEGLSDYRNDSFDYVLLNLTLQSTKRPFDVLRESLRIGKHVLVSFPNFAYIRSRYDLLVRGRMPKNDLLPYEWYDSPNIHLMTIRDFRLLCRTHGFPVRKELHFSRKNDGSSRRVCFMPNLAAQYGFFMLNGVGFTGGS